MFYVWCEIVCDNCATTTSGEFTSSSINRTSMKNNAIKNGWIFKSDKIYCKRCTNDLKSKNLI